MNPATDFTIITPAYFSHKFLEGFLESVYIQQGNTKFKLFLGIDSCKKTLIEAKKLKSKYPFLSCFFFLKRHGPFPIRNTLAYLATSEYLTFFDSDDIMLPHFMAATKLNTHKADMLVYQRRNYYDRRKVKYGPYTTFVPPIMGSKDFTHGTFTIKKETFTEKMGGFRDWKCHADLEFGKRLKKLGLKKKALKDSVFLFRRKHPDSITQTPETSYSSDLRRKYKRMPTVAEKIKPKMAEYVKVS